MEDMMNKPLYLFVGRSASGKTTVADLLESKYGLKQVQSYTTRSQRYEGEIGHIFVSKEEFDNLGELAAYTFYNGYEYGTTFDQLNECSIYVVDTAGVETLLERYHERKIVIFYFDTSVYTRINRMLDRGDSDMQIVSRLLQDEKMDWQALLFDIVLRTDDDVLMRHVYADGHLDGVVNQILSIMKQIENKMKLE